MTMTKHAHQATRPNHVPILQNATFSKILKALHPPMIFYILLPHIHIYICPYNFHVSVCGVSGDFERLRSHASQWDLPPRCEAWKLVIAGRRGGSQGSQGCVPRCHTLNTLCMSRHFPIFQWACLKIGPSIFQNHVGKTISHQWTERDTMFSIVFRHL